MLAPQSAHRWVGGSWPNRCRRTHPGLADAIGNGRMAILLREASHGTVIAIGQPVLRRCKRGRQPCGVDGVPRSISLGRCHATAFAWVGATRAYSSASLAHHTAPNVAREDEDDDYLQAYEDLLLCAAPDADAETANAPSSRTDTAPPEGVCRDESGNTSPAAADVFVGELLALLPAGDRPVLLTDLTRSLDVEAVCTLFGSVRAFVQLYPQYFSCGRDSQTGRWYVSRCQRTPSSTTEVAAVAQKVEGGGAQEDDKNSFTSLDMGMMFLEEELEGLRKGEAPCRPSSSSAAGSLVNASLPVESHLSLHQRPIDAPSLRGTDHDGAKWDELDEAAASPTNSSPLSSAWWSLVADLLPADGAPFLIAQLRQLLPDSIVEDLRVRGVGLARHYKRDYAAAHHHVALTADGTALARVTMSGGGGVTASQGAFWSPTAEDHHAGPHLAKLADTTAAGGVLDDGVPVAPPPDYDTSGEVEPWIVDVPFEDDDMERPDVTSGLTDADGLAGGMNDWGTPHTSSDVASELAAATGLQEVPYGGLSAVSAPRVGDTALQPCDLNVELLRNAPAPPSPTAAGVTKTGTKSLASPAPSSDGSGTSKARPPRPTSPAEWMALHITMAEARGWLTPMQMLDYLVECVPTFFIPLEELRPTDAIVKLVGAQTSMRTLLCRVYMYFVERSEDKVLIRLAASVEHAQRGAANVHYAQWDPDRVVKKDVSGGSDTLPDHVGTAAVSASNSVSRPGSGTTLLQSSATTKAFPVMRVLRPIKSRLPVRSLKTSGGAKKAMPPAARACTPPQTGASAASPPTLPVGTPPLAAMTASTEGGEASVSRTRGAAVDLASLPPSDIGYPFAALATQPVEQWPWWSKILCVLSFQHYVALESLSTHYRLELTPQEFRLAWLATNASQNTSAESRTPIPFALLRAPLAQRMVRLRPFWLAPGSTAELDVDVLPADLAKQLRPAWLPVTRVLARLSPEVRAETLALATRRPTAAGLDAEEAVVQLLQDCGRCCWVNEERTKLRRFAASSAMDDHFHLSLSLLYGFSSSRTWEPVATILDRASAHVSSLFPSCPTSGKAAMLPDTTGLVGMLRHAPVNELANFLRRHTQWFELKSAGGDEQKDKGAAAAAALPMVRRRVVWGASFS